MIVCNIAAIAGYYFLFQYIKTQSKAAIALTSTIDSGQQKNSHLSALRAVVKDIDGKRQQLTSFFLSGDAEIPFIEQMEALGKTSGLTVKTNSVSSVAGSAGAAKTFRMQLQVVGSWNSALYFLNQIENLPYDVHVQGVSLVKQPGSGKTSSGSWAATFEISLAENM